MKELVFNYVPKEWSEEIALKKGLTGKIYIIGEGEHHLIRVKFASLGVLTKEKMST